MAKTCLELSCCITCSQVMQHVAFISFYINFAFERWAKDTVIFGSYDCEWVLSSFNGSWKCSQVLIWQLTSARVQHTKGCLGQCVYLKNNPSYQQWESNLLPFLLLGNGHVLVNDFFFLHMGLEEQPHFARQLQFILMTELFRKRKCETSIT